MEESERMTGNGSIEMEELKDTAVKKTLGPQDVRSHWKEFIRQVISFGIVGVVNTLMGLVLIELFYNIFHWNYWVASVSSYIIGATYSFFANKKLTFKVKGNMRKTAIRFTVNVVVCYVVAYGIAKPLVRYALGDLPNKLLENIALLVGMGLYIIMNFFGQKFFVFRDKHKDETENETGVEKI